jgi:hypothetical protein
MTAKEAASSTHGYEGSLELTDADGRVVMAIRASIPDVDAPVWAATSEEPLQQPPTGFDPAGDTVIVRLADQSHPRFGDTAAAHVMISGQGHLHLAGNYSFHPSSG